MYDAQVLWFSTKGEICSMRAYSTASGGVIFCEDVILKKKNSPVSYHELSEERPAQKRVLFGKNPLADTAQKTAAGL